jgi:DNA-binding NtrC family response regulator
VLIVDDEAVARDGLEMALEDRYRVSTASSGAAALETLEAEIVDVMISDLRMPGMSGLELLSEAKSREPDLIVLMVTGFAAIDTAVEAMRAGAVDYIPKPYHLDDVRLRLARALESRELRAERDGLAREAETHRPKGRLIGCSPAMQEVDRLIDKVADTRASVLLTGSSGTGKELVARELHARSSRRDKPLLSINCGAIPEHLVESELFGHEKGAFTGAEARRAGLFEAAAGGTVLLDEVGELPASVQVALLRVLQQREVVRVGSHRPVRCDFRLLAATNRDLKEEVAEKRFREDLFYRLRVVEIGLPDLRDRPEDVPVLAEHFLERAAAREGRKQKHLSTRALELLQSYAWPGNVRELENVIDRAVILAPGTKLTPGSLPPELSEGDEDPEEMPSLADMERDYIQKVLNRVGSNRTRAAKILGIDRSSLWRKLKEAGAEEGDEGEAE